MRYRHSVDKSAEFLRLALPLMSRQAAAVHPVSYAVWYEYVSGMNAALKECIDRSLKDGGLLDEDATYALYRSHVSEVDEDAAKKVTTGFQRVLTDISASTAEAGDRANRFGRSLEKWSGAVAGREEGLATGVEQMLHDTRQMEDAIRTLETRLDHSRREIDELRREVQRARQDSLTDALTTLANRKGFDVALANCLADGAGEQQGPSLLMLDIDNFKQVNDSYGHLFGDKVIRTVAQILKATVKGKDVTARYGGEEFAILLPDTPLTGAAALAEQVRQTVAKSRIRRQDTHEVLESVTISLGVASYRRGESGDDFVGRADAALYAAKRQGRNRVVAAPLR
jgi:diguanylate cyclase